MVHMKLEEPFASDGTETAGNAGAQAGVHSEWAQWLREVARGERGARDLTFEQARAAVRSLLHGRATDAQVGAFLAAERMKGESVDELAGFVSELAEVVRDDVLLAELRRRLGPGALDCAGPYDGRAHSFAATVAAAAVLAAAGVPVFLHAPDPLPPKRGVSLKETVRCLDIGSASEWETGVIWRHRFAFVDTEAVHPGLRRLRRVREELGFRTWLNTAEKFLNLASAAYLVAGVFHGAALTKAAALAQRLPYRRCLIVQGVDGSEDLPVHREAAVAWVESGEVRE
ncbi:MAG: hypothetical protein IRZ33_11440, partial [Alicyclobacillaceae bacterium]|nr:hypothetical protein [Alicyclobacillaceae bacterium]